MKPKFSLLTLLLIVALVAMSVVLIVERKQARELAAQNKSFGCRLGLIDAEGSVGSEKNAYVRRLDQFASNAWKFRVRLPKDSLYQIAVGTLGLTEDQRPDFSTIRLNQGNFALLDQELPNDFEFQTGLFKGGDIWCFSHSINGETSQLTSGSVLFNIKDLNDILSDLVADTSRFSTPGEFGELHGSVISFEPGKPIVLLQAQHLDQNDSRYQSEAFVIALLPVAKGIGK